jgi:CHAT domain-containing protein/Flp pilus assembly protein TadD
MKSFSRLLICWLVVVSPMPTLAQTPQILAQSDPRKTQADEALKAAADLLRANMLLPAQTKLEQALGLYRSLSNPTGQRTALTNLALVYYRQGNYSRSLSTLQQTQSLPGDRAQRGRVLTIQGLVNLELGDFHQALNAFYQAEGSQIPDIESENLNRIGLGEAYRYLGWYTKAQRTLQQALKTPGDRGRTLQALGDVQFDLAQYSEAKDFYQQALQTREADGDRQGIARTLNRLGRISRQQGNSSEALDYYQRALQLMNAIADQSGKINLLNNLALLHGEMGLTDRALSHLQEALNLSRNNGTGLAQTLNSLGFYYAQLRQFDKAKEFYQQALAWAKKNGDRLGELRALNGLGKTSLQNGQSKQGIPFLQTSIEVFESLRPGLRDQDKVSVFEEQANTYRMLQVALVNQGDAAQALTIAERGRARAFVEQLANRLSDSSQPTLKPPTFADIQATAKKEKATLVTYSILQDQQASKLYIWVVTPQGTLTLRQVELKKLQKNQGVSVDSVARRSWNSVAAGDDQPQQLMTNLVVALRGKVITRAAAAPNPMILGSTRDAYELLIQPIADLLPTDPQARVIFIPQGSLFLVPFQALQDASGKYLIERHTILIAPSIQALSLLHRRAASSSGKSLVIGNPAPMPDNLAPLPGAEVEAKAVAQILKTQAIVGKQATKAIVVERLAQAQTIHLATHGLLDNYEGLQSALAFVGTNSEDGLLTAAEIFDLKLRADLAVLSACDTGRGRITEDGVIGLSRSLLSAGVSSVVVSLWAVPDLPTAQLMTEFYRNLQRSPDKAQALRQAMLTTMKQSPDPRDWAGFILIGSAE